jgi:hypothetical protein
MTKLLPELLDDGLRSELFSVGAAPNWVHPDKEDPTDAAWPYASAPTRTYA